MFKKNCVYTISFIILFFICGKVFSVKAEPNHAVDVYFFYSNACPHCQEMKIFLADLVRDNPSVNVNAYEVAADKNNQALFSEMASLYNISIDSVPMLFVGDKFVDGYYPIEVENIVNNCLALGCVSPSEKLAPDKSYKKGLAINLKLIIIIVGLLFLSVIIYYSSKKPKQNPA